MGREGDAASVTEVNATRSSRFMNAARSSRFVNATRAVHYMLCFQAWGDTLSMHLGMQHVHDGEDSEDSKGGGGTEGGSRAWQLLGIILSGFVPISIWPSPPSSGWATHIVCPDRPDPPDLTGLCLILFMDSHMFSFYHRMFLHMLSSSTFYLHLDPWSLISVTYPHLSDSSSH